MSNAIPRNGLGESADPRLSETCMQISDRASTVLWRDSSLTSARCCWRSLSRIFALRWRIVERLATRQKIPVLLADLLAVILRVRRYLVWQDVIPIHSTS